MAEEAGRVVIAPSGRSASTSGLGSAPVAQGSVTRNSLHLVSGQLVTTALSVVLNAQLGRALGATDFGLYFFLLTATYFAHVFVMWGQGWTLFRDVARAPEKTSTLLGSAIAIRVVLTIPAAVVGAVVVSMLGYDLHTTALMALIVVAWLPTALVQTVGLALRGHERMDLDARATVVNKLLHVAIVVVAFALGGRVLSVILSLGAAGAASLAYTMRQVRNLGWPRLRFAPETARYLMHEGAPILAMGVLGHAQLFVETLLLSHLAPGEVLGWYGAGRTISNTLIMPASILLTASFPRLSRAAGDPLAMRDELARALRPVLILGLLVAAGTAAFADVAIGLIYGLDGYAPTVEILQFCAPVLFLIFLNMLFLSVAVVLGHARPVAILRTTALVLAAALAWQLIPLAQTRWGNGAFGAIAAATAGEVLILAGSMLLVPRGVLVLRTLTDFLRALLCACAAAASLTALPVSTPFVEIPVFLVVFGAAAVLTRLVDREDLALVRAALHKKLGGG